MGAGAGYTVEFKGLEIDKENVKITEGKNGYIYFDLPIKQGYCESWKAEGYYEGVDSTGISYDGDILVEYDEEDRAIKGGLAHCSLFIKDAYADHFNDIENPSAKEIKEYISKNLSAEIDVSSVYGAGWSHSYLNPAGFSLGDYECNRNESCDIGKLSDYEAEFSILSIDIIAPVMAHDVNWFFAHSHELEEILIDGKESDIDYRYSSQIDYSIFSEANKALFNNKEYDYKSFLKDVKNYYESRKEHNPYSLFNYEKDTKEVLESLPDWQRKQAYKSLNEAVKKEMKYMDLFDNMKNGTAVLKKIIEDGVIPGNTITFNIPEHKRNSKIEKEHDDNSVGR